METASFRLYSKVNKALKIQILACVDDIYTRALKAKYVAYGNLSLLEVITHLKSNYYNITPAYLKENFAQMTSTYGVNQLSKMVIDQIERPSNLPSPEESHSPLIRSQQLPTT